MKESDYIKVTNLKCIQNAISCLTDVMPGIDYGITDKELSAIKKRLFSKMNSCFNTIGDLEEDKC